MALRIALVGDVMLGRGVDEALRFVPPHQPWGDVLPRLREADLRIGNLECAIAEDGRMWMRTPKVFHFRAHPRATRALRAAGFDAVSLANNHVLDVEVEGLLETLANLRAAGIAWAGAGRDLAEAERPALLSAHGVRVGLVAFTDNEPAFAAGPNEPGTFYVPISTRGGSLGRVEAAMSAARDAGAEVVIASAHWGPNMRLRPTEEFRAFARAVVDRGADVFHGHSAHVFQGIEIRRGRPILYDTGDFLDDYMVDPELRNDWSFVFTVTLDEEGLAALELDPVRLEYARVSLATGAERERILDRMVRLSMEMGTRFEREGGRLVLRRGEGRGLARGAIGP